MKLIVFSFATLLSACAANPNPDKAAQDKEHALNWTCENLAKEYRESSHKGPLCSGYDNGGWPIEDVKKTLPEDG